MNGDYSEWSSWSICSKTCGRGWKKRIRACNDPLPSNGGKDCYELGLGPSEERTHCFERSCPRKLTRCCCFGFYNKPKSFDNGSNFSGKIIIFQGKWKLWEHGILCIKKKKTKLVARTDVFVLKSVLTSDFFICLVTQNVCFMLNKTRECSEKRWDAEKKNSRACSEKTAGRPEKRQVGSGKRQVVR